MGSPDARITDIGVGICCAHGSCIPMTGHLITGANSVISENQPTSRCTDIMLGDCGHVGIVCSCSSTVFAESQGVARLGDCFSGDFSGTIVTGAKSVIVG